MVHDKPILCPQCKAPLAASGVDGTLVRCSNCGSTMHFKHLAGSVSVRGYLFRRARSPGKANFNVQREEGNSFHRKSARWHKLTRIIDRVRDWYYEHIVDAETENIVRHVDESLSKHRSGRSTSTRKGRK